MIFRTVLLAAAIGIGATTLAPIAHASDAVTYEVTSQGIPMMNNIEYVDAAGRKLIENVPLPWRLDVTLDDAHAYVPRGAQVRADWRPRAAPSQWVVVSITSNGKLLCRSALDVGDATCYGNTPYIN